MKHLLIILSVFSILLFSCRTSEQLIDLAIKRNPLIENGKNDTIQITKYIIDSIPVIINDSIIYEKIIREIRFDTIVKNKSIYIERKKTRLELRNENNLNRLNARLNKRIESLELRLKKRTKNSDNRKETKIERINNRSYWWIFLIIGLLCGYFIPKLLNKRININF